MGSCEAENKNQRKGGIKVTWTSVICLIHRQIQSSLQVCFRNETPRLDVNAI